MKYYKREFSERDVYWTSFRNIPIGTNGINSIGVVWNAAQFIWNGYRFTCFVARDEQEIDIKELPEEFRDIISDPLFEIEYNRFKGI